MGRGGHGLGTPIDIHVMLPAPAQGAIGIEVLAANDAVRRLIAAIDDTATSTCVLAARALLAALGADCHSPVAALATLDTRLRTEAALFCNDGPTGSASCRDRECMFV